MTNEKALTHLGITVMIGLSDPPLTGQFLIHPSPISLTRDMALTDHVT